MLKVLCISKNILPLCMTNKETYATIKQISSKTYAVIDSANQCRFATPSERKAKNFLNRLLKSVNA